MRVHNRVTSPDTSSTRHPRPGSQIASESDPRFSLRPERTVARAGTEIQHHERSRPPAGAQGGCFGDQAIAAIYAGHDRTAQERSPGTWAWLPGTSQSRTRGLSGAAPIGLDTPASVGLRHTRGPPARGLRPAFVLRRNSTAARQETRFARTADLTPSLLAVAPARTALMAKTGEASAAVRRRRLPSYDREAGRAARPI
jgi:hypothetical protein